MLVNFIHQLVSIFKDLLDFTRGVVSVCTPAPQPMLRVLRVRLHNGHSCSV